MNSNHSMLQFDSLVADTSMHTKLADYLFIAKNIGFEMVFEQDIFIPAELQRSYDKNRHYIMWHPGYSILLSFDSYFNDTSVNSGNFYYAWKPNHYPSCYDFISSGIFRGKVGESMVWVGSHDCRKALCFNIETLAKKGEFLIQWPELPHLWLANYADYRIFDNLKDNQSGEYWHEVNRSYLERLPEYVQRAICFKPNI